MGHLFDNRFIDKADEVGIVDETGCKVSVMCRQPEYFHSSSAGAPKHGSRCCGGPPSAASGQRIAPVHAGMAAAILPPLRCLHRRCFWRTPKRAPHGTEQPGKPPPVQLQGASIFLTPFSVGRPRPAKRASASGEVREPEGMARTPLPMRGPARRNGRGVCANRRQAVPDHAGFHGRRASTFLARVLFTDPLRQDLFFIADSIHFG